MRLRYGLEGAVDPPVVPPADPPVVPVVPPAGLTLTLGLTLTVGFDAEGAEPAGEAFMPPPKPSNRKPQASSAAIASASRMPSTMPVPIPRSSR